MGTKMHRGSKRAALIGAAALPAIAGLSASLMSSPAHAAMTVSVTNLGTAADGFGNTATGWTAFLLTVTADPGQFVQAIDFGTDTTSTAGIFGPMLQNWKPSVTKAGTTFTPSPVEADRVGQGLYGLDSHVTITAGRVDDVSPFEDNNLTNPGAPIPPNDATDVYGTGTYLRGTFGIDAAHQVNKQDFAYIVLKNGTSGTFKLSTAESGGTFQLAGTIGGVTTPPTHTIVALTTVASASTTNYGPQFTNGTGANQATFNPNSPVTNSINVTPTPGNGSYLPGFANNINNGAGQATALIEASGFTPAGDQEVYALDLAHTGGANTTATEDATVATDINASQSGTGVTAVAFQNASAQLKALFPTYDVFLLTNAAPPAGQMDLGLDLSQETNVAGLVVTNVAAVPEPASAAGILLGATGLLLGRRKRNA